MNVKTLSARTYSYQLWPDGGSRGTKEKADKCWNGELIPASGMTVASSIYCLFVSFQLPKLAFCHYINDCSSYLVLIPKKQTVFSYRCVQDWRIHICFLMILLRCGQVCITAIYSPMYNINLTKYAQQWTRADVQNTMKVCRGQYYQDQYTCREC